MMMRWIFVLLWAVLVLDLVWWSPPPAPDQTQWIVESLTGRWSGKNPATVALFNLMGVWPLVFAWRLVGELRARPIPAWPFVLGGMGLGAFVILPYLILCPRPPVGRDPGPSLRWLGSRYVIASLVALGLGLVLWGVMAGDWSAFARSFVTEQLIQVMSLDCVVLAVSFGLLWKRGVSSK